MPTDLELSMRFVDVIIIASTIGMLIFLVLSGTLRSKLVPNTGRIVLLIGIALTVAIAVADLMLAFLNPGSFAFRDGQVLGSSSPNKLRWLASRIAFSLVATGVLWSIIQRKRAEDRFVTTEGMIKAAQDSIVQSEARFRHLVETTSNSIYCYAFDPPMPVTLSVDEQIRRSHDAVLTECNVIFARDLGFERVSDAIGTRLGMLDRYQDAAAHNEFFEKFVDSNYRLSNYEMIYKTPDGEERAIKISLTGIVQDGKLRRMWGAETNVIDIRETRAALARRQQFQELVAAVSSRFVMMGPEGDDQVMQDCLREMSQYIGADRATLFWLDSENQIAEVLYSWSEAFDPVTESVDATGFPDVVKRLKNAEVIAIDDVEYCQDVGSELLTTLSNRGVKSAIILPFVVDGEMVGIVSIGHLRSKRKWTEQDIADLRVFAELYANFLFRLKSRRALDDALVSLRRATDRLEAENVYLREEIEVTHGFDEIVAECSSMLRCLHLVDKVADTMTPVLVLGETGTGKELIARAIHDHSGRRDRPLVKVNCAALPADLIESELFGYEEGAFTGATSARPGRFEIADGSTLFLDEIGDIPIRLQSKLLRVLQEGEFDRLGGTETIRVDVRIIAATNHDLVAAVKNGEFRSDLLYRINTFPIELPALRYRGDDIQLLAEHFVKVHSKLLGRNVSAISSRMMHQLREYSWPGNVRELESVIQRALITWSGPVLELADPLISGSVLVDDDSPRVLSTTIADLRVVEREHIVSVLEETGWKISGTKGAAARLGIPPSTLRSKMKKLAIARPH